jgi:hypothetical protein
MITVKATYVSSRIQWDTISIKGHPQKVMKKFHEFHNVINEKDVLLMQVVEVSDSKIYKEANLNPNKKYLITCSEVTDNKIVRPSKCVRVLEIENSIPLIQDIVTKYKSDFLTREQAFKQFETFSQDDIIKYFMAIIDKSKQKINQ